jgi:demethylmenaquinone methyltransferase / 2-methoxy-6-polyprenyl-1,4-benzoquinol methylase
MAAKPRLSRSGEKDRHVSDTVSFGYEEVAPEEKTRRVGEVFRSVAKRYDIMNDLMSAGMHRVWKDDFVRLVKPRAARTFSTWPAAPGTSPSGWPHRGANVTVADINPAMLEVGMERAAERGLTSLIWREENAETLSFPDRCFDAYTIAFGIRNVTDIPAALREAHRVLRFGGRFFCLEFSTTTWPGFAEAYDVYSEKLVPKIGELVAKDADSYRYLIESIRRFPKMPDFARMIEQAGFTQVRYRPILGGAVAIHSGWKV